jgi:tetratricopeptide (TPR) repeat protein
MEDRKPEVLAGASASLAGSARGEVLAVGAAAALHLALSLLLFPAPVFEKYPEFARMLAEGSGRVDASDVSPLYLLLNLALSPGALRIAQSLLGASLLVSAYVAGRSLFGIWSARLALGLLLASAPLLVYESVLEPEVLIAALNMAAIALVAAPAASARRSVLAGVALGLSIAARPSTALFAAGVLLWVASRVERRFGARAGAAAGVLFLASAATSGVGPVLWVRHAFRGHVAATMSIGAVVHMGNRPEGTGIGAQPPYLLKMLEAQIRSRSEPDPVHALYRRFAAAEAGPLTRFGAERFWIAKVAAFARWEPGAFAALWGRKLLFFLAGPDAHDIADAAHAQERLGGMLSLRAAALLGIGGLVMDWLTRRKGWLLALYAAAFALSAVVFYTTTRYSIAVLPIWCVLGGRLVSAAMEIRERGALLRLSLAMALVALLASAGPVREGEVVLRRGREASALGRRLDEARRAGDWGRANRLFMEAQAAQPVAALLRDLRGIPFQDPELGRESAALAAAKYGLDHRVDAYFAAVLAHRADRPELAHAALELAEGFHWAIHDGSLDPRLLRATLHRQAGNAGLAIQAIRQSLEEQPGTKDALAQLIAGLEARRLSSKVGELDRARRELYALHDRTSALFALGQARLDWGDAAGALESFDRVLADLPESGLVRFERARALLALSRREEALEERSRAIRAFPRHAFPEREFDERLPEGHHPRSNGLEGRP